MAESIVVDTTFHESPMTAGDLDMLLFALDRSHAQFAWEYGGLDAAEPARATMDFEHGMSSAPGGVDQSEKTEEHSVNKERS